MISRIFRSLNHHSFDLVASQLYNEQTFYRAFERDLRLCRSEAIIESPFITTRRVNGLLPILQKALDRGVRVVINTKPLYEHDPYLYTEAAESIAKLKALGVEILYTGGHHRKLAIFDRQILWEGSLNILSQNDSCEIMRRIESEELISQTIDFLKLRQFLGVFTG